MASKDCPESTPAAQISDKDLSNVAEILSFDSKDPSNTPLALETNQLGPNATELEGLLSTLRNGQSHGIAPAQSGSTKNRETAALTIGEPDLGAPISVEPEEFEKFKKWASTPPEEDFQSAPGARASSLEYKTVLERWSDKSWKYEVVDSEKIQGNVDPFEKYVFVVREHHDRKSKRMTRFIDVKSMHLRDILRKVLHGVRAVDIIGDKPSIEQNILIHFLPELQQVMEELKSVSDCSTKPQHLSLLVELLTEAKLAVEQDVSSLLANGHITFDLLWALFKPGCHVFTNCLGTGKPRCVMFDAGEFIGDTIEFYNLEAHYLDYNGEKFGEAGMELAITEFRGPKPIASLNAFPIQYHPDQNQVRKNLLDNGRKFQSLVGKNIRRCNGAAFVMEDGKPIKINIDGCVGVDAAFFYKMQPNYSRRRGDKEKLRSGANLDQMSEDELVICSPTVCGFSFQHKVFMELAVDDLGDMQWAPESFDCLKIPKDSKKLILSMVKSRLGEIPRIQFDDFVPGKGLGLNILLHGPPGVGKTSTVEAVAQYFKRPLYSISSGELGADHGSLYGLEEQLKRVIKIAKQFKAVVVIDEVDACMGHRTASHGSHNRLVTVFLHLMEYFDGIMFLTTNRATEIDEAVLSRIHIKIRYRELPKNVRREIWELFLSKAETCHGPAIIGSKDMEFLESLNLNGRDIKNLTSIAHAVASEAGEQVQFAHLKLAAGANDASLKEFENGESMYI